MSLFEDLQFFILAGAFAIPAIIMGIYEISARYYTLFVSIVFAVLAMIDNKTAIVYMALYMVIEIVLVKSFAEITKRGGLRKNKCRADGQRDEAGIVKNPVKGPERNKHLYHVFLFLSILPLGLYKISGLTGESIFGFIGISYMTFKSVQMIIEIYDGLIKEVKIVDTAEFFLFFPAILCGPIDRSRRFMEELNRQKTRAEYVEALGDGLLEICQGLVYKKVIGGILILGGTQNMYIYGMYLFFDFAGYSLMAIGMGRIYGISLPANFKAPFISEDIKEFWNRWHISLSTWFRDYLFSRILRNAMKAKAFGANRLTQACFCLIVNMGVMGIWHGLEAHYIVYGLYHGVLLAITEVYQKKSKFYKAHKKEKWYRWLSTFVTFNLIMFGFYIFSGQLF